MKPIIVFNFKSYSESSGKKAEELVRACKGFSGRARLISCVQTADSSRNFGNSEIYAQHVDSCLPARNTGFVTIESLKGAGVKGSLLNHSEHRISREEIKKTIMRARETSFRIILCVRNLREARELLELNPEMIAFEVPSLISSGKSITEYRGKDVREFATLVKEHNRKNGKKIISLCGAGISSGGDLQAAIDLGCDGVLLASAFVKSRDKKKFLEKFLGKL